VSLHAILIEVMGTMPWTMPWTFYNAVHNCQTELRSSFF